MPALPEFEVGVLRNLIIQEAWHLIGRNEPPSDPMEREALTMDAVHNVFRRFTPDGSGRLRPYEEEFRQWLRDELQELASEAEDEGSADT